MNVHVLQHVPFEGIGSMAAWLLERNARISYTRFDEVEELPESSSLDLLVIMGGPMSVNDEAKFPWLVREKQFIRSAIEQGVPVLGICLGAQLIASALGARVYQGAHREIGWFEIDAVETAGEVFQFPKRVPVFHWHGETFDLPVGAIRLARSGACENQAFQFGRHVIGLQCHLETTPESAAAIVTHCRHELVEDKFVQSEAAISSAPISNYERINVLMAEILTYLTR